MFSGFLPTSDGSLRSSKNENANSMLVGHNGASGRPAATRRSADRVENAAGASRMASLMLFTRRPATPSPPRTYSRRGARRRTVGHSSCLGQEQSTRARAAHGHMEDIERQLAAATLRAVRRESEERHSRLQTARRPPRAHPLPGAHASTRTRADGPSSSSASAAPRPLTREVEPRSFDDGARGRRRARRPPRNPGRRGAEMLGTDEVRAARAQALRRRHGRRRCARGGAGRGAGGGRGLPALEDAGTVRRRRRRCRISSPSSASRQWRAPKAGRARRSPPCGVAGSPSSTPSTRRAR